MSSSLKDSTATNSPESTPKSLMELDEVEYEAALFEAHRKAKKLARSEANTQDVLIAKLATLAIRQLHASDVYPRTAIRAMVHMEFDEDSRSTGGAIARAKRDLREEGRERRAAMEAAGAVPKDSKGAENQTKIKA